MTLCDYAGKFSKTKEEKGRMNYRRWSAEGGENTMEGWWSKLATQVIPLCTITGISLLRKFLLLSLAVHRLLHLCPSSKNSCSTYCDGDRFKRHMGAHTSLIHKTRPSPLRHLPPHSSGQAGGPTTNSNNSRHPAFPKITWRLLYPEQGWGHRSRSSTSHSSFASPGPSLQGSDYKQ